MRALYCRPSAALCLIAILTLSATVTPPSAYGASITVYTSEADYIAAVAPDQVISFNSFPVGLGHASPLTQGAVTINAEGQLPVWGPGMLGFTTNFLSKSTEPFSIDLAPGVRGVGMQVASPIAITVTVTAYDGMTVQTPFQSGTVTFLGFSSPAGIKSITFADNNPIGESIINIGEITYRSEGVCLKDEGVGALLQIDPATGDYQYVNCGGLTLGGKGTVSKKGGTITLDHSAPDRQVEVRITGRGRKGTASIQFLSEGTTVTITDKDLSNTTCSCQ